MAMPLRLLPRVILGVVLAGAAGPALAKKKPAAAPVQASAEAKRSMAELAGKFKWGMTTEQVQQQIEDAVHGRYKDLIANQKDVNKQDDLRTQELDEVKRSKSSLVKFDGTRTGWDVSIIDKEFQQRNDEAMITMWEKNQRRFLFFWRGKLYKQFIAFDAEHPAFKGKSFDDFVKLLEGRYGPSEMKFKQQRTSEDMIVDHVEWPSAGEFQLDGVDQSGIYESFCVRLYEPKVHAELDKVRSVKEPKRANSNALIDAVTKPDTVEGDKNADVVDQIMGKKK